MSEQSEKEEAKRRVQDLAEKYRKEVAEARRGLFTEQDVGSKFILPFLDALGWDTLDIDEVREQRRTLTGPADYSLNINKVPKLVVEIKKFSEDLDAKRNIKGRLETHPGQAIRYALHLRCDWVVLTKFEETRLYFTYAPPEKGLTFALKFDEYLKPTNFEKLWLISKASVSAGRLARLEKKRERKDIDEQVLEDLLTSRRLLATSVAQNNRSLQPSVIREAVQMILDRIIVVRTAEDRDIIGADSLWNELESWRRRGLQAPFMRSLKNIFQDFGHDYNGKLFEPHFSEELVIDNDVLEQVISLSYKYNFDLISADVLGSIYEDYIGHVLAQEKKGIDIVESFETRKEEGIYYTPTQIVDYVLRRTLVPYIRDRPLHELERILVLDSACGSASFLVKAFDYFVEEFRRHIQNERSSARNQLLSYSDIAADISHRIIRGNLYGVDLDPQAAEIASVNLMLKALRKGDKLPLILGDTVKCGNSLIWGTHEELEEAFGAKYATLKPFDWNKEFRQIMSEGGFDVVIGNPPHGAELSAAERRFFEKKYFVGKGYKNSASLFIESCAKLTKDNGLIGLVIPKSLTFSQKWARTREFITENLELLEIADLSKAFKGVLLEQVIIVLRKQRTKPSTLLGTNLVEGNVAYENNIPLSLCEELDAFPVHVDKRGLAIYHKLTEKSGRTTFGKVTRTFRGLPIQRRATSKKKPGFEPVLRGDDIHPYYAANPTAYVSRSLIAEESEKMSYLRQPKIVSQRIVAHILKPVDHIAIISSFDARGQLNFDTVENTVVTDQRYDPLYVLALLSSKLTSWFAYTFVFNKAVRTMDLDDYYVSKIPFYPASSRQQIELVDLVKKLLDLTPQLAKLDVDFRNYVNNYPQLKPALQLVWYYAALPHSQKKSMVDPKLKGSLTDIRATMSDGWVVVSASYLTENGDLFKDAPIVQMKFDETEVGHFILHTINHLPKVILRGNLLNCVLKILTPTFKRDRSATIRKIVKEYSAVLQKYSSVAKQINELESTINQKICAFYELTADEISAIEQPFSNQSVILSLFPRPRGTEELAS